MRHGGPGDTYRISGGDRGGMGGEGRCSRRNTRVDILAGIALDPYSVQECKIDGS